jgi:hypothetical protein
MAISPEESERIVAALNEKAKGACPACGTNVWSFVSEDYAPVALWPLEKSILASSIHIPAALRVCINCGYLQSFATRVLCGIPTPTVAAAAAPVGG